MRRNEREGAECKAAFQKCDDENGSCPRQGQYRKRLLRHGNRLGARHSSKLPQSEDCCHAPEKEDDRQGGERRSPSERRA